MGHNLYRQVYFAQEYAYSYAVWLVDERDDAKADLKKAMTAEARAAAEAHLAAVEAVIALGKTVGIDTSNPGPYGKATGSTKYSMLLVIADWSDEAKHGTVRKPGGTRRMREPKPVRRIGGAGGGSEDSARRNWDALVAYGYIEPIPTKNNQGRLCRFADIVPGWWDRVVASGFPEAAKALRKRHAGHGNYPVQRDPFTDPDNPDPAAAEQPADEPEEERPAAPAKELPSNVIPMHPTVQTTDAPAPERRRAAWGEQL